MRKWREFVGKIKEEEKSKLNNKLKKGNPNKKPFLATVMSKTTMNDHDSTIFYMIRYHFLK